MPENNFTKIVITTDGPYIVTGDVPIVIQTIGTNSEGGSWEWEEGETFSTRETVALCRCGKTITAPFCNGEHTKIKFDGTETASREPYEAQKESIDGPTMILDDARPFCAVARFCDTAGSSWDLVGETDNSEAREMLIHQTSRCPSGRLVARDRATGLAIEPNYTKSIGVVEDPAEKCSGPLWVRGGIPINSIDGTPYETRNRVTLCRCGASKNKPFCDGSHIDIHFHDGRK